MSSMKKLRVRLASKKFVTQDVCHFYFSFQDDDFSYNPGQYIILTIPTSTTPVKRLYSFANAYTQKGFFELIVKLLPGGAASEYLSQMKEGDDIEAMGPAGLFSLQNNEKRKIYMATGTGIAPIRSFLTSQLPHSLNSLLFWGLKDIPNSYLMDELFSLKNNTSSFDYYYCFSQQASFNEGAGSSHFRSGHIDDVWRAVVPNILPNDEYYLCGSRMVIESLRTLLLSLGVDRQNLFFEKY